MKASILLVVGLFVGVPALAGDAGLDFPDIEKTCDFAVAKKVAIARVEKTELAPNPMDADKTVKRLSAIRGAMDASGADVYVTLTAIRNYVNSQPRHRIIANVVVGADCEVKSTRVSAVNSSFALGSLDDADAESKE